VTPGARPAPLRPGDLVAVVAPSGPVHELSMRQGIAVLESWGLRVRVAGSIAARDGYLAGTDARRADEFASAFDADDVRAVWCARGGYGATRIANVVADAVRVARDPKWLVGFSDITTLHRIVRTERDWITLHATGVEGLGRFGAHTVAAQSARALLFSERTHVDLEGVTVPTDVRPDVIDGVIDGGNLALVAALCGTRWALTEADIFVTEDVNERPYRIDRLLTQVLGTAHVRALAFGQFTDSGEDLSRHGAWSVDHVLADRARLVSGPAVRDLPIGHIEGDNVAVPLGARARIDGAVLTITLED